MDHNPPIGPGCEPTPNNLWAQAVTHNNLGLALVEQGRTRQAETEYRAAYAAFHRLDDDRGRAVTLGHRAWSSYLHGRFDKALQLARNALALYGQQGDRRGYAISTRTLALILAATGRCQDAVGHLKAALAEFQALQLPIDVAMTLNCLGETYTEIGDVEAAQQAYQRAAAASRSAHSAYELARATDGLRACCHQ